MSFKTGDLVWAKMKGFPPWPGLISEPPEGLKENITLKKNTIYHCIYFFGSKNYSWIETEKLKPYLPFKKELSTSTKSLKFKKACKDIEDFLKKNHFEPKTMEADGFDKLLHSTDLEKPVEETKSILEESSIEVEGFDKMFPTIRLEKLEEADLERLQVVNKETNPKKRILSVPSKVTKKKKSSNYSDADTTTPLDSSIMCESPCEESKEYLKEDSMFELSSEFNENDMSVNDSPLKVSEEPNDTSMKDDLIPSDLKIGFIGIGVMGKGIVKNLIKTGHIVTIWNRSSDKVNDFQNSGAKVVSSPGAVVTESDIIFCCVSDATASKDVMFKPDGVLDFLTPEKSYVDMTSVDVETSLDLSEATYSKGSRYMEVRLQGSHKEADEGTLVCLAAGDESLYNDCSSIFKACSKKSFFMGEAGNASKMHLVIQLMAGVTLAGIAESMALADRAGLDQSDLLKILQISHINCPLIVDKAAAMREGNYATKMALRNLQNDLRYALTLGDFNELPTPLAATANELFKHAKKLGYGGHDVSAIILGARF